MLALSGPDKKRVGPGSLPLSTRSTTRTQGASGTELAGQLMRAGQTPPVHRSNKPTTAAASGPTFSGASVASVPPGPVLLKG